MLFALVGKSFCHTRLLMLRAGVPIIRTAPRARNSGARGAPRAGPAALPGRRRLPFEADEGLRRALRRGVLFERGEAVDDAAEVLDALDEVVEPYVLVGRVRVRAEVADAEGDDRGRRL